MSTRLELIKRYLQEDPDDSFLRYAMAIEYIGINDHENAYLQLKNLIDDDPEYLAAYYMTGKSAEALGRNEEAIYFYEKGIEVAQLQNDSHTKNELIAALGLIT